GGGTDEQDVDTVSITVSPVVDIADDTRNANEDSGVITVTMPNNDTFENSNRSITAVTQGAHGTVVINDNATPGVTTDDFIQYTQFADYNGSDTFTYTVTSGGATETATVTVNLAAVVDIANDSTTVAEDSGANVLDMLGNDTLDTHNPIITVTTRAAHGAVAIDDGPDADGMMDYVTYTPASNYNGADSFTYTVTSG